MAKIINMEVTFDDGNVVRLTRGAPGETHNLGEVKAGERWVGYRVPHKVQKFTPYLAELVLHRHKWLATQQKNAANHSASR